MPREFKDFDSLMWSIVTDHVQFVGNTSSLHASKLGYMAVRYSLSPQTLTKYRKEIPQKLAGMLLMLPGDGDNFCLFLG